MTPYERGYAAGLKAGYLAGFNASGEDWNGEYPFDDNGRNPADDQEWVETRDAVLSEILSLHIEGEADQRGAASSSEHLAPCSVHDSREAASVPHQNPGEQESLRAVPAMEGSDYKPTSPARPGPSQECVMVPREPKKGLLCGDVAISTDPRYAGWVFVRHVDGINWTTGAKLTPETWAMLAATKEES